MPSTTHLGKHRRWEKRKKESKCVWEGSTLGLTRDLRKVWKERKKQRGENHQRNNIILKPEEKRIVRLKGYSKYSAWWKQAYQCIWKLQEEKQSLQRNQKNHTGIKYLISYLENEEKSEFEPTHIQTTSQVWKQDKDLVPHIRTLSISFQHSKNQEDTSYIRIT